MGLAEYFITMVVRCSGGAWEYFIGMGRTVQQSPRLGNILLAWQCGDVKCSAERDKKFVDAAWCTGMHCTSAGLFLHMHFSAAHGYPTINRWWALQNVAGHMLILVFLSGGKVMGCVWRCVCWDCQATCSGCLDWSIQVLRNRIGVRTGKPPENRKFSVTSGHESEDNGRLQ